IGNQNFTTLANTVTVRQDGDLLNNSNTVNVTIAEPVVEVNKIVSDGISDAGDPINYTITITNNGNATAFNVTLEDILPGVFNFYDRVGPAGIDLDDVLEVAVNPAGV